MIISFLFIGNLAAQTSLEGKVSEADSGEPVLFGTVAIYKDGVLITGTETDLDGNYVFANIDPGNYDIEFSYVGFTTQRISGVIVKADQINKVDAVMTQGEMLDEVVIVDYVVPLVDFDNTTQGGTVTAEEIRSLPTKNITAIAATSAGISTVDGGDISIRGSRTDGTYYYVDGVRVRGDVNNLVPQSEIDQLQIIIGGIEAKYGDVTGGVISITTKGPSEKFSGNLEIETSEFLDPYGYNLASASLSGPILKNKANESILGFRLFGQVRRIEDSDPTATGVYRASAEKIAELEANPVTSLNGTLIPTGETLLNDDIGETLKAQPNETDFDYSINGKIDARLGKNVDVSLSGGYFNIHNQFTPSTATSTARASQGRWSLLNWTNNPFYDTEGYRANFRFRHKLGKQGLASEDEEDFSIVRNASYIIQVGVEKNKQSTQDNNHGENLFNYGYYGNQARTWEPVASFVSDSVIWDGPVTEINGIQFAHQGYQQVDGEYTPNLEINPTLARINNLNGFEIDELNGLWGTGNSALFFNAGRAYNRFLKQEEDRFTLNVSSGFDLLPGGSEKGKHNIQFGFTGELRVLRQWTIVPGDLWGLARLQANTHISGVDNTVVIDTFIDPNLGIPFLQYQTFIQPEEFEDAKFFKSVRELTGQSEYEYVNVDALDPNQLSLDMFSAGELINYSNIGLDYYGYDYLGNKLDNSVTFDDFFDGRDAEGRRNFNVAPIQPIYGGGYIQDKFKYKDIIVRVGLRLDYYDRNTKVLKDPYSLYEIESASDFYARTGQEQPASVDDNYKVYVAGEGSQSIIGFRDGDNWFNASGTSVSGGNILFGGGLVYPSYVNSDAEREINSPEFNPDISFEDYTPQLNVMPRVAFSFPITKDAGFFAHYDVLVQRPPSNTGGTPLDYYFFEVPQRFGTANSPANNPDLKPEKTVDYEVGFQSKISNSSAIKISAYYKENRDQIQARYYTNVPAPLITYQTYGNIDFGTVKGFSFSYDMRRTGNIQFGATYQFQTANGSGSDANSSSGLNRNGNIRTLFPLDFDERHRMSATVDYRFSSGKKYNGPTIGSLDIFENAGLNLILTTVSGRPYNQYNSIRAPLDVVGLQTINEARLPWIFNVDARIDKQFQIKFSKESEKSLNVNVYLRAENLFNTRNIVGVWGTTGSPDDDGYIISTFGEDRLEIIEGAGRDVDSFLAAYYWRLNQPGFYVRPRRIYLGAVFDF